MRGSNSGWGRVVGAGLNGWCDNGSLSQTSVQVAVEHERLGVNEPWHG